MTAPLVLVDPPAAPFWPLAATRPVAELLGGTQSFHQRWAARVAPVEALWCEPAVAGARIRGERLPVGAWPDPGRGLVVALSTWVPPRGWDAGPEPAEFRAGLEPVAWRLVSEHARALRDAASPEEIHARLRELGLPSKEAGGRYVDSVWALVDANPELIVEDAGDVEGADTITAIDPFVLLGDPGDLKAAPGATIGPFAVLDAREGPIVLGPEARVDPHTLLQGPLYVGSGSVVLADVVTGSSIGPRCRIHGDVEQTIVQGYSNKAHEGFVGHTYLGEWVNLGAGTTTSDLKNTYGSVRVEAPEGMIDTGLLKAGAFLGDHVKTGIGTLLTSGARMGVATHLFGGAVSPRWLPDFSWHDGRERTAVRWEPFLRTAEIVMARRDETMSEAERQILAALHARATQPSGAPR